LKELFSLEGNGSLLESLEEAGVGPGDVDMVLFTHLHVEHMGGALDSRDVVFPNASFLVQNGEWEAASRTSALTMGAYSRRDLEILEASGRVIRIDGDAEPLRDVRLVVTGGHTRFHQIVLVGSGKNRIMLPGDLLPSTYHFRLPCIAAVDLNREDSFRQKSRWMKEASDQKWVTTLYHEAGLPAGQIVEIASGRYKLEQAGERSRELGS